MSLANKIKSFLTIATLCCSPLVFGNDSACGNNEQAIRLAKLIGSDPDQQRKHLRCNKLLTKVAAAKVKRMAEYGLVIHNLGGSPNSALEEAGYRLPEYYGRGIGSNQVEAIAGGYEDADEVWYAIKKSIGHRTHLLGENKFYLEQDELGVAFFKDKKTPHVEYWAVYLTASYDTEQRAGQFEGDMPNKNTFILLNSEQAKYDFEPIRVKN